MKKIHDHLMKTTPWYAKWHKHPNHRAVHYGFALAFAVIVVLGLSSPAQMAESSHLSNGRPFTDLNFAARMHGKSELAGQEAVNALGQDIARVARFYGQSEEKFRHLLLTDKATRLSPDALLFFAEEISPGDGLPNNPTPDQIPDSEVFNLHSKPGAGPKIYLNFRGATVTGTSWNYNGTIAVDPYTWDTDPSFSTNELDAIKKIWRSVAEDYSLFNVDVTTEQPVSIDQNHYIEVIVTPTHEWYGNAGGVAFVGSFRWAQADPVWVFAGYNANGNTLGTSIHNTKEAASHEIGHAMGLYHTARYDANCVKLADYHSGHGSNPGWAPIMGVGYYRGLVQWSNTNEHSDTYLHENLGNSYGCNSEQNDISIIDGSQGGDLSFATDETGNTPASANGLSRVLVNGVANVDQLGVITPGDTDLYRIDTIGGDIQITVNSLAGIALGNVDFRVRLLDGNLNIISESNPAAVASATVSAPIALSGTYYIEVAPSGYLDQTQAGGYTAYGSVGQYNIVGTYNASGADLVAPMTSINTPVNGATVSGPVTISASASDNESVSYVEFYHGTTHIGTDTTAPYSAIWNTLGILNGSYQLSTKAYDVANNIGVSSPVTVTVNNAASDTVAPAVSITAPANGVFLPNGGSVTVSAAASDNVKVTRMELLVDGVVVAQNTNKTSVSYKWSMRKVTSGSHVISAKAYDAAGNVGQSTIAVTK